MPPRIFYLPRQNFTKLRSPASIRRKTTVAPEQEPVNKASVSKWLSSTKGRIARCIMFGMSREQAQEAGMILEILGRDWRELVAGRLGFLVDKKRAGLSRHKIVWGEMDSMKHINNVMYIRYAESARVNWIQNYANYIDPQNKEKWRQLCTPEGYGMILHTMKTRYLFPMTWPDHISVYHKITSIPSARSVRSVDSLNLDVLIVSELHQRIAATCEETIVTYDYEEGKKAELQPWLLEAFSKTLEEQNAAMATASKKIEEIEEKVRKLEINTWDRADAVEDMGAAKP